MARRDRNAEIETADVVEENFYAVKEAPVAFDPSALVFEDSDEPLPPRTRKSAVNPYAGIVANSLETGRAKKTPALPTAEIVSDVTGLLRRAASDAGHGIEVRAVATDAGTVLHFQSKEQKRSRSYTVADVRSWASENGYSDSDLFPRVKPYVSNAYRETHGLKVNKLG